MSSETENDNPYSPPAPINNEVLVEDSASVNVRGLRIRWCVVTLVNVPIPVMFGMGTTTGAGQLGMPVGIGVVLAIGLALCSRFPRTMSNLCRGAVLTALSQFYPMLHIVIGMLAVTICKWPSSSVGDLSGIFEGTLATLITGAGLIAVSLIFGIVMTLIFESVSPAARRSAERKKRQASRSKMGDL